MLACNRRNVTSLAGVMVVTIFLFLVSCGSCLEVEGDVDHYHYLCVGKKDNYAYYSNEEDEEDECYLLVDYIEDNYAK